jgi:hypothetical protein
VKAGALLGWLSVAVLIFFAGVGTEDLLITYRGPCASMGYGVVSLSCAHPFKGESK